MRLLLIPVVLLLSAACTEDPVGPVHVTCDDFLLSYGTAGADTVLTTQGLRYINVETGSGTEASSGLLAEVNYSGYLLDGTQFDTSCPAGIPVFRLTLGGVDAIPGFQLGIFGMQPGGVRRVIVPPSLGYGSTGYGPIPPNSTLVFDIELVGYAAR